MYKFTKKVLAFVVKQAASAFIRKYVYGRTGHGRRH